MASLTLVKVLFCGQGMTTLVEVYDDGVEKDSADFLALVDCGGSSKWGTLAVDQVVKKVLAKKDQSLDYVIISHQDQDHVGMLKELTEQLQGTKASAQEVCLGGMDWEQSNKGTVRAFVKAMDIDLAEVQFNVPYLSNYEGVTRRSGLGYLAKHKDVFLRVLVSGLEVSARPDIRKNASSAVVTVENASYAVVLPGDATYQTMEKANSILNIRNLLPTVIGFEIPHHGALRTAVENYVANRETSHFDFTIITSFAEHIAPKAVAASAGPWNSHHHPIHEVLQCFDKSLIKDEPHTYVSYGFDFNGGPTRQGWKTWNETMTKRCTVEAIEEAAKASTSHKQAIRLPSTKGKQKTTGLFVYGDIVFKLAKPGVFRAEEMVEFRPRGFIRPDEREDDVLLAPAP